MLFVFCETDRIDQVALRFGILPFPTTQLFLRKRCHQQQETDREHDTHRMPKKRFGYCGEAVGHDLPEEWTPEKLAMGLLLGGL